MIKNFFFGAQPCTHNKNQYEIIFLKINPFIFNNELLFCVNATCLCPICQNIDIIKNKILTYEHVFQLSKLYNSNKKTSNANVYKLPFAAINKGNLVSVPQS